jgi:hypothetical protein
MRRWLLLLWWLSGWASAAATDLTPRIDALLAEHGADEFAARFLADAGLNWAADLLADFPTPSQKE